MRINGQYSDSDAAASLVEYLEGEVQSLRQPGDPVSHAGWRAAAEGVATFLRVREGSCFRSEDIALLMSRALWAAGYDSVACRLLEKQGTESGLPVSRLEVVAGSEKSFAIWRSLLSAGVVRLSGSVLLEGRNLLTIDLRRLFAGKAVMLELEFFGVLGILLDTVADLWDASRGRGILGLKHVGVSATGLFSLHGRKRAVFVGEVMDFCEKKFASVKSARSWKHAPGVVNLDLGGS